MESGRSRDLIIGLGYVVPFEIRQGIPTWSEIVARMVGKTPAMNFDELWCAIKTADLIVCRRVITFHNAMDPQYRRFILEAPPPRCYRGVVSKSRAFHPTRKGRTPQNHRLGRTSVLRSNTDRQPHKSRPERTESPLIAAQRQKPFVPSVQVLSVECPR